MRASRQGTAYRWGIGLLVLAMGFVIAAIPPSPSAAQAEPLSVKFGTVALKSAADLVVDHDAGLVYVSQFETLDIKVIDLATADIVNTFALLGNPVGIELSADGSDLYVALYKEGKVAVVDTTSGVTHTTFDVRSKARSAETWEVLRVGDRLFVASLWRGKDPHLVAINLSTGVSWRVEGTEKVYNEPRLVWDGDSILYAADRAGRLVSLLVNRPGIPVAATSVGDHGKRVAASSAAVLTDNGDVLDPLDHSVVLESRDVGYPARNESGSTFYVASELPDGVTAATWRNRITRYQGPLFDSAPAFVTKCKVPEVVAFETLPGDAGFLILGEDRLCVARPLPGPVGTCGGLAPTLVGSDRDDYIVATSEADVIMGLAGDDKIEGLKGHDVLCGGSGDDTLIGSLGDDQLYGGGGSDVLDGGFGDDVLRGRTGIDTALFAPRNLFLPFSHVEVDLAEGVATGLGEDSLKDIENLVGSEGNDLLYGDAGPNVIDGYSGSNVIRGRGGSDHLIGFIFDDDLAGGGGNDVLEGGRGNDLLSGGYGEDSLLGGHGLDVADFSYSPGKVKVQLRFMRVEGPVDDELDGIEGAIGTKFADFLEGDEGDNSFEGGKGYDRIYGLNGNDVLDGGPGDDWLDGGSHDDRLWGGAGEDTMRGDSGSDLLVGGTEDDDIKGGAGDDDLDGGAGNDQLVGDDGDDLLLGGPGNDLLRGNGNIDLLLGQAGDDTLMGGGMVDAASYELAKGPIVASLDDGRGNGEGRDEYVDIEALVGSHTADTLTGDKKGNILIGLSGADELWGGAGTDDLYGEEDDDVLYGEANNDFLHGGDGVDELNGGSHVDQCVEGEILDSCEYIAGVKGVLFFLDQQRANGYRAVFRERLAEWERSAPERTRPVVGLRNMAAPMLGESLLPASPKGMR